MTFTFPLPPTAPSHSLTHQFCQKGVKVPPRSTAAAFPSYPKFSPEGYGSLHASEDVPAGTIVEQFQGPDVRYEECADYDKMYVLLYQHPDDVQTDQWRYLLPLSNARYSNHSCEPNCFINDEMQLETLRAVKQHQELTFLYNMGSEDAEDFWDPLWTFDCRCGAAVCQGRIDRYRPYTGSNPTVIRKWYKEQAMLAQKSTGKS